MDKIDFEKSLELGRLCFQAEFGVYVLSIPAFIFLRAIFAIGISGFLLALLGHLYNGIQAGYLAVLFIPFFVAIYCFDKDLKLIKIDLSEEELLDEYFINLLESKNWIIKRKGDLIYAYQFDHRLTHHLYIFMSETTAYMCVLCDGPMPFDGIHKREIIEMVTNYSNYMKGMR